MHSVSQETASLLQFVLSHIHSRKAYSLILSMLSVLIHTFRCLDVILRLHLTHLVTSG
jgi:hypothetical protein